MWHEGLEEASRLYFTDNNPEGMIAFLEPLHDMLEAVSFLISCETKFATSDILVGSENCT